MSIKTIIIILPLILIRIYRKSREVKTSEIPYINRSSINFCEISGGIAHFAHSWLWHWF
jgi:hypothetical protein